MLRITFSNRFFKRQLSWLVAGGLALAGGTWSVAQDPKIESTADQQDAQQQDADAAQAEDTAQQEQDQADDADTRADAEETEAQSAEDDADDAAMEAMAASDLNKQSLSYLRNDTVLCMANR